MYIPQTDLSEGVLAARNKISFSGRGCSLTLFILATITINVFCSRIVYAKWSLILFMTFFYQGFEPPR